MGHRLRKRGLNRTTDSSNQRARMRTIAGRTTSCICVRRRVDRQRSGRSKDAGCWLVIDVGGEFKKAVVIASDEVSAEFPAGKTRQRVERQMEQVLVFPDCDELFDHQIRSVAAPRAVTHSHAGQTRHPPAPPLFRPERPYDSAHRIRRSSLLSSDAGQRRGWPECDIGSFVGKHTARVAALSVSMHRLRSLDTQIGLHVFLVGFHTRLAVRICANQPPFDDRRQHQHLE